jgi:hypothetical protein
VRVKTVALAPIPSAGKKNSLFSKMSQMSHPAGVQKNAGFIVFRK